jgi:hypothetical protein
MNESPKYIPGVCNINPIEIKRRKQSGYFSFAVAATGLGLLLFMHAPWPYFITLFIPLFIGTLSILQAKNRFCVAYAASKQHHADDGDIETITDEDAQKADALKARSMYLKSLIISLAGTILVCLLPLIYS